MAAIWAAVAVVGMGIVLAVLTERAAHSYALGKQALTERRYGDASTYFSQARIAGVWYRDSAALLTRSEQGAVDVTWLTARQRALSRRPAAAAYRHVVQELNAGDLQAAAAGLAALASRYPDQSLGRRSPAGRAGFVTLSLVLGSKQALIHGQWTDAGRLAAAALARAPGSPWVRAVARRAAADARVAALIARATRLLAAGHWRLALAAVRQALAIDSSFPGASALQSKILAARPAPAPTAAPAATPTAAPAPPATTAPAPPAPPPP
jgi:hypothetical protein